MKYWPFPLLRNYKTHPQVDAVVRLVLSCPDVEVTECEWPHSHYSVASCSVGELRFWSRNGDYAYASDGTFTPADGSDRMVWKDVMPSRWAVRRLMQLAERDRQRGAVWREPQTPAGVDVSAHTCKFQVIPEGCGGYYLRCACGIVKSTDELTAGVGAPANYCATDGTCSCRKFAADPTSCERWKELAAGVQEAPCG